MTRRVPVVQPVDPAQVHPSRSSLHLPASRSSLVAFAAAAVLTAGCASPAGPQVMPQTGIPAQLPVAAAGAAAQGGSAANSMNWQSLVQDPKVQALLKAALENNRDLRVAASNVQLAQAQLRVTDASRKPTVGVGLGAQRAPNSQGNETSTLTAGVQVASWELDFFGRLSSLSDAAKATLLAGEAGRRAATLSVAAQVVSTALAFQADQELLAIAERALASRNASLKLTELREQAGAASALELQSQRALVAQAAVARAQVQRALAQDRNALALLVGRPIADKEWPTATLAADSLADVPVGLQSAVLLSRPDVVQAEHVLAAARANIGAARAAFWPSITLTAQAGQASSTLAGLFQGGHFAYTVAANAALAIFDSGRRQANVDGATAAQQVALAQYERAVQSAFRDTADALAGVATWQDQLAAQLDQRAAVRETARLTELKARQGAASELERLDAERNLLAVEQAVVQLRLAQLNNRVALFKALGGPPAP